MHFNLTLNCRAQNHVRVAWCRTPFQRKKLDAKYFFQNAIAGRVFMLGRSNSRPFLPMTYILGWNPQKGKIIIFRGAHAPLCKRKKKAYPTTFVEIGKERKTIESWGFLHSIQHKISFIFIFTDAYPRITEWGQKLTWTRKKNRKKRHENA